MVAKYQARRSFKNIEDAYKFKRKRTHILTKTKMGKTKDTDHHQD